jgi:hypothetical protein
MTKNNVTLMAAFITFASLASAASFARTPMVDGIAPDIIVQSLEMKGTPGYKATAAIIKEESEDPQFGTNSLVIVEIKGVQNFMMVNTKDLSLDTQTQPKLSLNKSQSLLVTQDNSNYPSRDQWTRTITISYLKGKYVISGFTYGTFDKLSPEVGDTCDYNLLSGKGKFNGNAVTLKTKPLPLDKPLPESFQTQLYDCKGW